MSDHTVNQDPAPAAEIDPDYPLTIVPRAARKSLLSLSIVLLGFTVFTPTMLAGAGIAPSFGFGQFLLVATLGSLVLGIYVSAIGGIGARTGLTTVVMSRYAFGDRGSKLVSLLLGGTQIGWYGVPSRPWRCWSSRPRAGRVRWHGGCWCCWAAW